MRIIPQEPLGVVEFAEAHQPVWDAYFDYLGLSKDQMQAYTDQMKAAREKYDLALAAREAAQAATLLMRTEVAALRRFSAGLVAQIKAFAAVGGTQDYPGDLTLALGQIDPPHVPGTAGVTGRAPGKAVRISAQVGPTGGIKLSWQAQDAAASTGAFFVVSRRLAGESAFSLIGTSPGLSRTRRAAEFTDSGVPTGIASVAYQVTGRRANAIGEPSEVVTVTLGSVGVAASPGRLAA